MVESKPDTRKVKSVLKKAGHRSYITEGIFIAAVTALGYGIAFLYELGYCHYFDIPTMLIDVSIASILSAIFAISVFFITVFAYFELGYSFFAARLYSFEKLMMVSTTFLFISTATFFVLMFWLKYLTLYISCSICGLMVISFLPLIYYIAKRKSKPIKVKNEQITFQKSPLLSIISIFGANGGKILFVLTIILWISYVAGGLQTILNNKFVVISKPTELVVIKNTHRYFLAASFDRDKKTISNNFRLIAKDTKEIDFKYETIRFLKPAANFLRESKKK